MAPFNKNSYSNLNHLNKRKRKIPILRYVLPLIVGWFAIQYFDEDQSTEVPGEATVKTNDSLSVAKKTPQLQATYIAPDDSVAQNQMDSSLAVDTLSAEPLIDSTEGNAPPEAVDYTGSEFQKDTLLGNRISIFLDRYKPTGAFILMVDAQSNEVLAWGQRSEGKNQEYPTYLNRNTFPAASIAKTLTATAALDHNRYSNHSKIAKIGNSTKLYKSQLKVPKGYKGTKASLEKAYSKSYNPVFGIVGQNLGKNKLLETAKVLGMNQTFPSNHPLPSQYIVPDDSYGIAEVASGFTETTTLSPLHTAGIFRSLVMGQALQIPWSKHIPNQYISDRPLALPNPKLKKNTYFGMKKMMQATTESGTARKGFNKNIYSYHRKRLITGGKTGTIDGGDPKGRYDWFAGFAEDKKNPQNKVIIVVMQHHGKIWTLRSSHLAGLLINQWAKHRLK